MDKNHITELLPQYIDGVLDAHKRKVVENHLDQCTSCAKEFEDFRTLFKAFENEEATVPPAAIRTNFLEQLKREKQTVSKVVSFDSKSTPGKKSGIISLLKVAASIVLLIGSYMLGKYHQEQKDNLEIATLEDKTLKLKQTAMLSLMENESASKRIQGVHYVEEFSEPDEAIVKALADRMLYDENTNVRLTAVEVLGRFTNAETVKNAFLAALQSEKDPRIQITIIHTLVEIQEKKAIVPMQKLLEKEETQPFVKNQIESLIPSII